MRAKYAILCGEKRAGTFDTFALAEKRLATFAPRSGARIVIDKPITPRSQRSTGSLAGGFDTPLFTNRSLDE